MPLNDRSQSTVVDHEEKEGAKNVGVSMTVPLLTIAILVVLLVLAIAFGGKLYLLILLVYAALMAFGLLLRKSRKAEKIMKLNRMNPWGDDPIPAPGPLILTNILTAQKLPEWEIEKSELVKDAILIVFNFFLWILLIILPHSQGPIFYWWSYFSPVFELLAVYIIYPIFLVVFIIIYYNDIKIYKSKQLKWQS